jgi:general secretion pathway protein L
MPERLLIRLHPGGRLTWLAQDAHGRAISAANSGAPTSQALARVQRIVVVVPAEDVLLLDVPRLPGNRMQVTKALPFALEDQLASPVEELHFAVADRVDAARMAVALVARDTLRGWLEQLAAEGIRADAMYAETQLLPSSQTGCLLIEDERALWRTAVAAGVCDVACLPDWLAALAADAGTFEALDFRTVRAPALPGVAARRVAQGDVLAFFAGQPEPGLSLLQGEFASMHRQAPVQQLWRNATLLAAAALVLLFAYYGADCWRLSRETARLDLAARQALHEGFPEMDKVAGDPRALMQSALTGLRGGSDASGLIAMLGRIGPALGGTRRTTLTALEYHNATLELGLRAPDVPTLDLLREQLAGFGLKVDVTAANSGNEGVDGRLRIAGAAR